MLDVRTLLHPLTPRRALDALQAQANVDGPQYVPTRGPDLHTLLRRVTRGAVEPEPPVRYPAPREYGEVLRLAGLYSVTAPFDTVYAVGWAVAALGAVSHLHPVSSAQRAAILYGLRFDPRFHDGCALCLAGSLDAAVEYVRVYLPEVAFGRNTRA